MITVIDYGMGNLGSVLNMLKKIGAEAEVTGDIERVRQASKILLPGVGAFDAAMERLNETGLATVLNTKALEERVPVLGICLGMQLLTYGSEEGTLPGLGWIPGNAIRFSPMDGIKVPHMGWNAVIPAASHPLLEGMPDNLKFYFVHSFHVSTENPAATIATTTHGIPFASVIAHENIMGAQFHPERSHRFGARFLENFARI